MFALLFNCCNLLNNINRFYYIFTQRNAKSCIFETASNILEHDVNNEQLLLEQRLLEQQRQSEEDGRWLAREEVIFCFIPSFHSKFLLTTRMKNIFFFIYILETSIHSDKWR